MSAATHKVEPWSKSNGGRHTNEAMSESGQADQAGWGWRIYRPTWQGLIARYFGDLPFNRSRSLTVFWARAACVTIPGEEQR